MDEGEQQEAEAAGEEGCDATNEHDNFDSDDEDEEKGEGEGEGEEECDKVIAYPAQPPHHTNPCPASTRALNVPH